jgi:hypothetical protein
MFYAPYYDPPATSPEHSREKSAVIEQFFTVAAKMFDTYAAKLWSSEGRAGVPPTFHPTVSVKC